MKITFVATVSWTPAGSSSETIFEGILSRNAKPEVGEEIEFFLKTGSRIRKTLKLKVDRVVHVLSYQYDESENERTPQVRVHCSGSCPMELKDLVIWSLEYLIGPVSSNNHSC